MATYGSDSPWIDKDAEQADLERKNKVDLATINAVSRAMQGTAGAGSMPSSSPFGGSQSGAPATTNEPPSMRTMSAGAQPAGGAGDQDAFASFSSFLKETDPSLQALRAKATAATQGQFDNPAAAFDQGAAIAREDLGRGIASAREAQKEELIKTYGANASQVMPALHGFDQEAILQTRDLNRRLSADRSTAAATGLNQAIANAMGLTGQASQERLAAAGLDLERENREDSQAFAAAEAALGRTFTSTERKAVQAWQTAERLGAQDFASAEAALGRKFTTAEREAIQAYQTSERLSAQDFTRIMTERGWTNERELDTIRRNHEKELQATGISAEQARQMADQAHQERMAVRAEAFQATQAEITRKWTTGERIETQEFQKGIQANEHRQQEAISKLEILAREALAKGGWDQESKLQAERLLAEAAEAEKTRSAQYLMFSAQMAQEDNQFAQEFGLKREAMALEKQKVTAELKALTVDLGIKEEAWANAKVDRAIELATYGLEMWNGENEAALQPFITQLAGALGEGMGMDKAILEKAIQSAFQDGTGSTGTTPGSVGAVNAAKDYLDSIANDLKAGVPEKAQPVLDAIAAGSFSTKEMVFDPEWWKAPGRGGQVKAAYQSDTAVQSMTQEAKDYYGFVRLKKTGLSEKQAFEAWAKVVGADRAKAAYKAMAGKDWNG